VLKAERDDLRTKEDRAKVRDDLDRRADARPIEQRGDGAAWALLPEQRTADFLKATTGMSTDYSLGRVVKAIVTGDWRDAEREQRAMSGTSNTAGGYFIPSPVSANVIDLMRNASVMIAAGSLTVPMATGELRLVRVMTDPSGAWRAEGQTITASDMTFGSLNFYAKSLAALCEVSAELIADAPNAEATIDNALAAALALKLDLAGLYGAGNPLEPAGLRGNADVNEISMGANGATPTDYDNFLNLVRDVELDNGTPATLIWSPRTKNTMAKIVTGIASDKTKLEPPADFAALRKLVSNQVSVTETQGSSNVASTAFLGGFNHFAFGMRQQLTIEVSKVSGDAFSKNMVHIRGILRADGGALRPSQFGRLVGILA